MFALLFTWGHTQSGNQIDVQAHQFVNLFAQNRIVEYANFPDESISYQNVNMIVTMGCMNGDSCSHWDYDLDVYVGDSTGVMDSTLVSIDSTNMNSALWDTTWNVFEVIEWHELGRYVTPYGNYMNWNQEGFDGAWEHYLSYDVTDFSPIENHNVSIIREFGLINIAQLNLNERNKRAEKFLTDLRESEVRIAKALEDKYGPGTVNLTTGEFNSTKSK